MSDDDDADGVVGYCQPPKKSRFKKGVSGNKNGRPRRKTNFEVGANMDPEIADLILKEASRTVSVRENGRAEDVSIKTALLRTLNHSALKGDHRSQIESLKLILAADRLIAEQKSGLGGGACPHCSELAAKSDAELMEDIMDLLSTGRVKLPAGIELEIREDEDEEPAPRVATAADEDDDDPWDVA
jgi:hypothetical protein